MRRAWPLIVWCLVPVAGLIGARDASAGAGYSSSVVDLDAGDNYNLTKIGKVSAKPSVKAGDGGVVLSLKVGGISCTGVDASPPAKCGTTPILDHVMDMGVYAFGNDLPSIVGIRFSIEAGKTTFQSSGKSSVGGAIFGPLVSAIYGEPLGISSIKLREPGSDPSDCGTVPLPGGNGCTDGVEYAVAGIIAGTDPGLSCTMDDQCTITNICSAGKCIQEPCTMDADCNNGGGTGSGECGDNGKCCDPSIDPTCPGQVP